MTSRSLTSTPPPPSSLNHSPAICFNTVLLRGTFSPSNPVLILDFLRKSRQYSDDSIETYLNSLLPSRKLFSTPTPTVLEPPHCADFIRTQLFPTWSSRDDLLTYCSALAEKPVEESSAPVTPVTPEVSERVDPYVRRKKEVWEKHDELKRVIRQENGVEAIIRMRTWEVVVRRCQLEGIVGKWDEEIAKWREKSR
jgi:hypothetical protein